MWIELLVGSREFGWGWGERCWGHSCLKGFSLPFPRGDGFDLFRRLRLLGFSFRAATFGDKYGSLPFYYYSFSFFFHFHFSRSTAVSGAVRAACFVLGTRTFAEYFLSFFYISLAKTN